MKLYRYLIAFQMGFMANSVLHDAHIYNILILFLVTMIFVLMLIEQRLKRKKLKQ